jgi:hypothetical protein
MDVLIVIIMGEVSIKVNVREPTVARNGESCGRVEYRVVGLSSNKSARACSKRLLRSRPWRCGALGGVELAMAASSSRWLGLVYGGG